MRYRRYGKDGPELSVLGFGAMRLPPRGRSARDTVNFTKSAAVIRRAMEGGVNFIDSHHGYHGGLSEVAIGRALKGWRGHRIYVQTKTPFYSREPLDHFKRLIDEALEKTGKDAIDYLLFHSMRMDAFKKRARQFFKLTDWAIKRGLVRFRGFSSHDTPENVKVFIDTGEFSSMVVSFNFLNRQMEDTIAYAADRGMGVAIMNPVGGGALAAQTPQIMRLVRGAKSPAEVAFRYVLSIPGVTTALSGMNEPEQVEENLRVASRKTPLTAVQRREMLRGLKRIEKKFMLTCTSCGYCMPCPHGVNVPENFLLLNQARFFGLLDASRKRFASLRDSMEGDGSALACRRCGSCLPKCPNNVPIMEQLEETAALLGPVEGP